MRKAISLKVNLWIEGEDEPAHNFAESTKQAVKEIIEAGSSKHPELKITIKNLGERGVDDDSSKAHAQSGGAPAPTSDANAQDGAGTPQAGGKS
ncbi:MAG: hypothetical protein QOE33_1292 [Acidobacteriota bacterium]|nr:hypothetical protein [Acidobacteriota bacterium]